MHPVDQLVAGVSQAERSGDKQQAIGLYRKAISIAPERTDLRLDLVRLLLEVKDADGAYAEATELVRLDPRNWLAANVLGVAAKRKGQLDHCIAEFKRAAELNPQADSPWINLGSVYRELRDFDNAICAFKKALEASPKNAYLLSVLGVTLLDSGEVDKGLAALDRAIKMDALNAEVFHNRAIAYYKLARYLDATRDVERALAITPSNLSYCRTKALILRSIGRLSDSKRIYEEILREHPHDVQTLQAFARLLTYSMGDHKSANEMLRKARALRPKDVRLAAQLCAALMESRYDIEGKFIDEAYSIAAPLIDADPPPLECAADLQRVFFQTIDFERADRLGSRDKIFQYWISAHDISASFNQLSRVHTQEDRYKLVEFHRAWGRSVSARSRQLPKRSIRSTGGRKLRIGLMSSDLRNHPVGYFALPLVEHYNRERYEIYCYSFFPQAADRVQAHIVQNVDCFRGLPNLSNEEVAQQIANDQVDVLFELGGFTRYNRLEVMALRPAPIQVSWLGYPHSSGLAEIDYILVDPYLKPDDPKLLIEQPFMMSESWVCLGRLGFNDSNSIEPGVPEERARCITFGTANNPYKFTRDAISLWARVLIEVPQSRFLIVRPEASSSAFRTNVAAAFSAYGVDPNRIDFAAVRGNHLPYYNRIDIALDTLPHTGGTTTCESLWMGVPTVTMIGAAFFERLSYSNLSNAGLGDLCARTPDQYVDIARQLASDRHRRRDLRHGLRNQILSTPLGQTERWVRHFEQRVERVLAAGPLIQH